MRFTRGLAAHRSGFTNEETRLPEGWDWTKVTQPARGSSKKGTQGTQPRAVSFPTFPSSSSTAHLKHYFPGAKMVLKGLGKKDKQQKLHVHYRSSEPGSTLSHCGLHTSSDGGLTTYAGCLV